MNDDKDKLKQKLAILIGEIKSAKSADAARNKLNQVLALIDHPELSGYIGEALQAYLDNPYVQAEIQSPKVSRLGKEEFNEEQFNKSKTLLDGEIQVTKNRIDQHHNVVKDNFDKFLNENDPNKALAAFNVVMDAGKDENIIKHVDDVSKYKKLKKTKHDLLEYKKQFLIQQCNGIIDESTKHKLDEIKEQQEEVKKDIDKIHTDVADHYTKVFVTKIAKNIAIPNGIVDENNIIIVKPIVNDIMISPESEQLRSELKSSALVIGESANSNDFKERANILYDKYLNIISTKYQKKSLENAQDSIISKDKNKQNDNQSKIILPPSEQIIPEDRSRPKDKDNIIEPNIKHSEVGKTEENATHNNHADPSGSINIVKPSDNIVAKIQESPDKKKEPTYVHAPGGPVVPVTEESANTNKTKETSKEEKSKINKNDAETTVNQQDNNPKPLTVTQAIDVNARKEKDNSPSKATTGVDLVDINRSIEKKADEVQAVISQAARALIDNQALNKYRNKYFKKPNTGEIKEKSKPSVEEPKKVSDKDSTSDQSISTDKKQEAKVDEVAPASKDTNHSASESQMQKSIKDILNQAPDPTVPPGNPNGKGKNGGGGGRGR